MNPVDYDKKEECEICFDLSYTCPECRSEEE